MNLVSKVHTLKEERDKVEETRGKAEEAKERVK